jgi:16S rRNA (guanine527-N7)-methyltransferase
MKSLDVAVGVSSVDARAQLREVAAALGLSVDEGVLDALLAYLALLQRWNKTYNLTAVRASDAMLTHHLADCLALVPSLRRHLMRSKLSSSTPGSVPLLDVGSGGGLPGVVLALLCPELAVTCVDTVGKKAAFIRQAALELRLSNLQAVHARVESLAPKPWPLITARAFSSLADLVGLTQALLAPSGAWVAMKGRSPADEFKALPPGIEVFHVEQLTVPGLDAERCLVWMGRSPG